MEKEIQERDNTAEDLAARPTNAGWSGFGPFVHRAFNRI